MAATTNPRLTGVGVQWSDSSADALVGPDGYTRSVSLGYRLGAVLGDSLASQHLVAYMAGAGPGTQGYWAWANALLGSPFTLRNFGYPGATVEDVFSRGWQIPPVIDCVFITAGTNDVLALSSGASAGQVTTEYQRITGIMAAGIAQLKAAGKRVALSTIPPNSAYSSGADSRISLLAQVNAWINARIADGTVFGFDLFAAIWDSAQPTLALFGGSGLYTSDGTHLTNVGGYVGGKAARACVAAMYAASGSIGFDPYDGADNALFNISQMRTISGLSSTITYGSGTLASGWRSLNSGSGTPTLVLSNADQYTASSVYVGPWAQRTPTTAERWQKLEITGAISGSIIRLQLATQLSGAAWPQGIMPGDTMMPEFEVMVEDPVALAYVGGQVEMNFSAGTSPVDQPYSSATTYARSSTGIMANGGTSVAMPEGFRCVWRGNPVRAPENISTSAVTAHFQLNVGFNGAGSANVYVARAAAWRRCG